MSSDQVIHDLEQRYVTLRRDYESVVVDRDAFKGKVLTLLLTEMKCY